MNVSFRTWIEQERSALLPFFAQWPLLVLQEAADFIWSHGIAFSARTASSAAQLSIMPRSGLK